MWPSLRDKPQFIPHLAHISPCLWWGTDRGCVYDWERLTFPLRGFTFLGFRLKTTAAHLKPFPIWRGGRPRQGERSLFLSAVSLSVGRLSKTWDTSCVKLYHDRAPVMKLFSFKVTLSVLLTCKQHWCIISLSKSVLCIPSAVSGYPFIWMWQQQIHNTNAHFRDKLNTTADAAEEYAWSIKVSYNKYLNGSTL